MESLKTMRPLTLLRKSPLSNQVIPIQEENLTIKEFLKQQYPLPIGDLLQDPLTTMPWWKYQTMYFHHLLQLHPDHPNKHAPELWDLKILAGPMAKHMLIIREIVLHMKNKIEYNEAKEIPQEIKDILPLLHSLTSLEHLTCIYTIYMPIMGNILPTTAWDHLYNILQLILSMMKDHSTSASGIQPPQTNKLYTNPIL